MELAERTDPERWQTIMDGFFRALAAAVHRFEGTVDKFTGDGIMALFGAPIAHEDHAQRACYAALEMQRAVGEYADEVRRSDGISLTTRIGINSGDVVVGSIGEDLSLSYTAVGHTVGLAQRMEALAEPGKAYLTAHTARLAAGFLEMRDLGEFEIKGASEPLEVHELTGVGSARGRLDVAQQRGFSPFVGRSTETSRAGCRPGANDRGQRRGDRHRRRRRRRQEPALPRVRRALPRARDLRLRGPVPGPRQGDPAAAGAADDAGLLRDRARGLRARGAGEGRRAAAAARSRFRRRPRDRLRAARNPGPGAPRPADERGGAPAPARGRDPPHRRFQRPAGARGHAARGPALDRPRQRAFPEGSGRGGPRHQHPRADQLPPRVPGRVDEPLALPPAPAGAAGARGPGGVAVGPAWNRPIARRALGDDPRADRRQPLLRRGGGARAGRVGGPGGRPRRLQADPRDRRAAGAAQRAGDPLRAHRPPRCAGQGDASGRRDDRQGVRALAAEVGVGAGRR